MRGIRPWAARAGEPEEGVSAPQAQEQLQRILSNERFAHSERLRRFLRYVVEETLAGRQEGLKEYSLGVAVFDRDSSYDPRTDPIVRVEAGRLRSRLNEYYSSQGAQDLLIIELPKGSYSPTMRWRAAEPVRRSQWAKRLSWTLDLRFAALLIMAAFCAILAFENRWLRQQGGALPSAESNEIAPIWEPFLSSQAETVIIFGSPLFFESEKNRLYVRQYDVNEAPNRFKAPEFLRLDKLLGPLSEPRYVYAQAGDVLSLHLLGVFLGRYGKRTKAIPAHQANWDAIKESNIICVGPARLIPLMARLPVQFDFELQPDYYVLNRNPQPGEQKSYFTPSHRDAFSYAVVASAPGLAPGREILVVTSHASAGTKGAVEYLMGQDTTRDLIRRLRPRPGERRSYQILLRMLADHDQGFRTEYVTHHSTLRPTPKP